MHSSTAPSAALHYSFLFSLQGSSTPPSFILLEFFFSCTCLIVHIGFVSWRTISCEEASLGGAIRNVTLDFWIRMPHLTTSGLWSSPEIKNRKNLQMISLASGDFLISLIYMELYRNEVTYMFYVLQSRIC